MRKNLGEVGSGGSPTISPGLPCARFHQLLRTLISLARVLSLGFRVSAHLSDACIGDQ
jgi:hypothetical protein